MRHITAPYLVIGDTAVIEMAKASGLTLLSEEERNPMIATSYGTGQLVADAVRRGCRHIIVGLGGSATSDCGIGMLRAIIDNFAKHGSWDDVHELDGVHFTIATDVTNPLCGENGAAYVFAPQKFAVQRESDDKDSNSAAHQQNRAKLTIACPERFSCSMPVPNDLPKSRLGTSATIVRIFLAQEPQVDLAMRSCNI